MSVLAIHGATAAPLSASQAATRPSPQPAGADSAGRLTIQPREAATATRTAKAGEYTLDSLHQALVYVPEQAVGTRRVPLVVFFGGGGVESRRVMDTERPLADKYGMILLAPNISSTDLDLEGTRYLDNVLKQVLRQFAIDPDKIALAGSSMGGALALKMGCQNSDVFSRVAPISFLGLSKPPCGDTTRPLNRRTQFFLDVGLAEEPGSLLAEGKYLRQNGHIVREATSFRAHRWDAREHDHVWRWFKESWTSPSNSTPPARALDARKVPELNAATFGKLKAFWFWLCSQPEFRTFMQWSASHPPSMWDAGPGRPPRPTIVVAGQHSVAVNDMLDMPAFARAYPSIATGLRKVGLTPQQERDYRTAFVSAYITMGAKEIDSTVAVPAAMARNVAFLASHAVADTVTFVESDVGDMLDYMVPWCPMSYNGLPDKTCPNLEGWLKRKASAIQDRRRERQQEQDRQQKP